jgi:hypothetical protein
MVSHGGFSGHVGAESLRVLHLVLSYTPFPELRLEVEDDGIIARMVIVTKKCYKYSFAAVSGGRVTARGSAQEGSP